jgi:integrase
MPSKFPKPFFRSARNCWFVQIGGKQVRLHPDEAEAMRLYHELMASRAKPGVTNPISARADGALSVAEVFDKFLDWCGRHREARTFSWYRDHIQSFLDHLGRAAGLPAPALKPYMVVAWADTHAEWGGAYRRGAITAVQRPLNWAVKLGHLDANPVRHIEKPRPTRRENAVTAADWGRIKAHYPEGDPFAGLLEFAWETGARPQEAKRIEARHLQLARQRVVFPAEEAKGRKRPRVIHLTPRAAQIVAPLAADHPEGPLFLNEDGHPWTAQAMSCRFGRLKKHLGVKFAAYDFRHGFCERLLECGADHLTVAELLGHADGRMVATVYSHLGTADRHLRETLRRASGGASA